MKHIDFIDLIDAKTENLHNDKLLFWDLWCVEFLFEKIKDLNNELLFNLKKVNELLWKLNDKEISINDLLSNDIIDLVLYNSEEDLENLNEDELEEKALYEIFIAYESILSNLKENGEVIYNCYEHSLNYIDYEIEGISITTSNANPIYLKEINSQLQLSEKLDNSDEKLTFLNRKMYR
ncbi:hypothetical protein [Flavobacterium aestivum]|uniref:hypothetical protein n=1 Tax=Flavobacterium aestivum TaxID=3003257 RepID=UPI00228580D8|nr:hypothetical protein [Flavobacterium aestivum]